MDRRDFVKLSALAVGIIAGTSAAAWEPGEPVTTYWFGPGCPGTNKISLAMTDAWATQLKEGGFNTVWARTPEELDIAARHGLRVIYSVDPATEWAKVDIDDPVQKAKLTERINRVKNHPALYIYEHYDEASADLFPQLARVKEYIHELDPEHPCWHNLLPTYANHKQLGVGGKADEPQRMGFGGDRIAAYWEHVRLFCDVYQPEFITYDHYQLKKDGDSRNYFLNLGIVQQNAAARRVPFWNGLQACTWVPGSLASPRSPRIPNVDEMRYLAHTTAAYGASGLYWYVYGRADHSGTIAAPDGTVGEKYDGVKKINREFIAFSKVLGNLSLKAAYMQGVHAPGTTPYDSQELFKISPETPHSEVKELERHVDSTLVTRLESPDGRTYLMFVNCDYRKERTIRVRLASAAKRLDPENGKWTPVGREFDLDLRRGGGVVVCMAAVPAGEAAADADAKAETVRLVVDHLESPANIGARPTFGWQMLSERRGAAQTAYRIRLFERSPDGAEVWDSGVVADGRSVAVRYGGRPLRSAMRYAWTVSVRDERGKWLKPASASFDTGLFGDGDWTGSKWISAVDSKVSAYPSGTHDRVAKQEAEDGTSCFVKTVPNGKAIKEAWLAVSGLGVFEAYVNGEPVSRKLADGSPRRDFLKPGFTHFAKTKHSFTYDVTHLVKTGAADSNVIAAEVSAGWWRDKIVNFVGKKSALRAMLTLRHEDGSETRVGTDETWLSAVAGPVLRAAIFDGEDYDARIYREWLSGSGLVGFKASEPNGEFGGALLAMEGPGISLRRDLSIAPVEMYVWKGVDGAKEGEFGTVKKLRGYKDGDVVKLAAGETLVVDFGQNAAAVPEFEFEAAAGTTLTMRPAEMLNDGNGAKSRGCDGPEGSIYKTNYRRARTTLNYTFAGGGVETYHPEFTFFGYRYASIVATSDVRIKKIRSVPVSSIGRDMETGRLSTGVADVNRLVKNVLWGQYSNYLSVPTDCPQRNERLGWTADTQVFALAGAYNADTYGFFVKWMRDMRDTQHGDGSYTGVAPEGQYGCDYGEQLGWADAGIIVPYTMWRQFGDTSVVEQNWDSMRRYMALVDRTKFMSPAAMGHQWADWLSYEKLESWGGGAYDKGPDGGRIPKEDAKTYWQFLGGCYLTWDARMMAEMAEAAGFSGDAEAFREMAERNLAYMRRKFLADDGMLLPLFRDMQTPALFALKLGIIDLPDAVAATKIALLQNFSDHGDCLQTGFLGTSILMDALTYDVGVPDMAYSLLLQHKNPSWLYSVDQGATTIWERWNSYTKKDGFGNAGMNSFNHYAYGAVLSWMYGSMAGIRAGAEGGYRRFVLAPLPDRRMGSVDAAYRSPYGEIRSAWRYDGGLWTWKFTVPANTSATVTVPGGRPMEYSAGTYEVSVPLK